MTRVARKPMARRDARGRAGGCAWIEEDEASESLRGWTSTHTEKHRRQMASQQYPIGRYVTFAFIFKISILLKC